MQDFLPFVMVILRFLIIFAEQPAAALVSGGGHDGPSLAALDDRQIKMRTRQSITSVPAVQIDLAAFLQTVGSTVLGFGSFVTLEASMQASDLHRPLLFLFHFSVHAL
jgi:hypothetical protein